MNTVTDTMICNILKTSWKCAHSSADWRVICDTIIGMKQLHSNMSITIERDVTTMFYDLWEVAYTRLCSA